MKITANNLLILMLCFFSNHVIAQGIFALSGKVTNEKGEAQKAATVFISGTQKITATDDEGKFTFSGMSPGSYQLSVKLLGFMPYSQNVIIQIGSVNVNVALVIKINELKEVVIGPDKWEQHYKMFKDYFLGTTANASECVIINPKVLSFHYSKKKDLLTANADDFLIIENRSLGYRIRYMLKYYTKEGTIVNYDGETVFEELEDNDKAKKRWQQNRANSYRGSFMHFARAAFRNTVMKEGFIVHQLDSVSERRAGNVAMLAPGPVNFDTVAIRTDSALVLLKFKSMFFIAYNPLKAAKMLAGTTVYNFDSVLILPEDSLLKLHLNVATIDSRGSYGDYRTFFKQGLWGRQLMADKLPFEYQPPAN
jgi:hypothetical protein